MWHGKVLMPYIKVGFPKRPGAKQKFLFAVVTLLNCPIISDNVMQLTGSCLVTEAIFFKAQTSRKTIKKKPFQAHVHSVWPLCIYQCPKQISMHETCQLCVSLPWSYPGMRIPGPARTWLCPDSLSTPDSHDCVSVFDPEIIEVNGKIHLDLIIRHVMRVGESREDWLLRNWMIHAVNK